MRPDPDEHGSSADRPASSAGRPAAETECPRSGNAVPEPRVAAMFDSIAPVYDRMNTLMTAGLDGRWRRAAVRAARLSPGQAAIDLACGTGKLTAALGAAVGPTGRVVGVDTAAAMLDQARRAFGKMVQIEFQLGNALALTAQDNSFDAATIAFGLRNLASFEDGFREMARVVKPGGRVVCLELSRPRHRPMARAYSALFRTAAPALGAIFRRRAAYAYLPHSLQGFPDPETLAETMRRVGLQRVSYRRLGLGAVALHVGEVG